MVERIQVSILVTEKYARIFFPNKEGITDTANMFFGETLEFRLWCTDIFNHMWDNGERFDLAKIHKD